MYTLLHAASHSTGGRKIPLARFLTCKRNYTERQNFNRLYSASFNGRDHGVDTDDEGLQVKDASCLSSGECRNRRQNRQEPPRTQAPSEGQNLNPANLYTLNIVNPKSRCALGFVRFLSELELLGSSGEAQVSKPHAAVGVHGSGFRV